MIVIGSVVAFARLWDLFSHTHYRDLILIAAVITLTVLIVIAGFTKRFSLESSSRSIALSTEFLGMLIWKQVLNTSQSVWVRARLAGGYQTAIVIEIGTQGYETTQLMKISSKSGKNIPLAEDVCKQVALKLGLENKGFQGLA